MNLVDKNLKAFTTTSLDRGLIDSIVNRAIRQRVYSGSKEELSMDLTACHNVIVKLDLVALLNATKGTFGHDVCGIHRYIDRENLVLGGSFHPRLNWAGKEARDAAKLPKKPGTKRKPTKTLVADFEQAARIHGWQEDQGTGSAVINAKAEFERSKSALLRRCAELEKLRK